MPNSLHPALSALAHQLRIIYIDERGPQASADVWSPASAATLQRYGRRFAAELYMASQQLRNQIEAMEGAEPEVFSELQRTLWSVCIWELCLMVFVGRPAVLTEALIPWWQLHLCDREVANDELPALLRLERPEAEHTFWRTLRSLVARGMRADALRLLKQHSVLRAGDRVVGSPEEQVLWPLLDRLESLVAARANLLISGATGAGKTTLLAALLGRVPAHERIVTIDADTVSYISLYISTYLYMSVRIYIFI
jgi:predicted AAA+ superfamily ATPase